MGIKVCFVQQKKKKSVFLKEQIEELDATQEAFKAFTAVIVFNPDGSVLRANDQFFKSCGLQ